MPLYTLLPQYFGEISFCQALLRADDGRLHMWCNLAPPRCNEVDCLIWDEVAGVFCIEVKGLRIEDIEEFSRSSLVRRGDVRERGAAEQASDQARRIAGLLDRSMIKRPFVSSAVAFPLVRRQEFCLRFSEQSHDANRMLFQEDLTSLTRIRQILAAVRQNALSGLSCFDVPTFDEEIFAEFHRAITGRSGNPIPVAIESETGGGKVETEQAPSSEIARVRFRVGSKETSHDVPSLLDETIRVVRNAHQKYDFGSIVKRLEDWRKAFDKDTARLRVAVVGEFKAGKSSLINALLGEQLAFVDEFEATAASTVYEWGRPPRAVVRRGTIVEEWSIGDYLRASQERRMADVDLVRVYTPCALDFDLVDTPGLGSRNREHTEKAEREIKEADVIVWCVDPNDVGSAQESAFLERTRTIGLPLLVVLTKADSLQEQEISEVAAYLAEETGIDPSSMIPLSSRRYQSGTDRGVEDLLRELSGRSNDLKRTREDSQWAKSSEIVSALDIVLREVLRRTDSDARCIEIETAFFEGAGKDASQAALLEWRQCFRNDLAQALSKMVIDRESTEDLLANQLRLEVEATFHNAAFGFSKRLAELFEKRWNLRFIESQAGMQDQIRRLKETGSLVDEKYLRAQLDELKKRNTALAKSAQDRDPARQAIGTWGVIGTGVVSAIAVLSFTPLAVAGIAVLLLRLMSGSDNVDETDLSIKYGPIIDEAVERTSEVMYSLIEEAVFDILFDALEQMVRSELGVSIAEVENTRKGALRVLDEISGFRPVLVGRG